MEALLFYTLYVLLVVRLLAVRLFNYLSESMNAFGKLQTLIGSRTVDVPGKTFRNTLSIFDLFSTHKTELASQSRRANDIIRVEPHTIVDEEYRVAS